MGEGLFFHCQSCGAMAADGSDDFTEITEEMVLDDLAGSDPDEIAEALESVGNVLCNSCGSVDVVLGG